MWRRSIQRRASPRRGGARHARFGAIAGLVLDLTCCEEDAVRWGSNLQKRRDKAERLIDEQRHLMLIGSPMCTAFSNLQNTNKARRDPEVLRAELGRARVHLQWCCKLYRKQLESDAYFLHEHPAYATSWKTPEVMEVLATKGVGRSMPARSTDGQRRATEKAIWIHVQRPQAAQ